MNMKLLGAAAATIVALSAGDGHATLVRGSYTGTLTSSSDGKSGAIIGTLSYDTAAFSTVTLTSGDAEGQGAGPGFVITATYGGLTQVVTGATLADLAVTRTLSGDGFDLLVENNPVASKDSSIELFASAATPFLSQVSLMPLVNVTLAPNPFAGQIEIYDATVPGHVINVSETFTINQLTLTPIPEPGTMALLACGLFALHVRRRLCLASDHRFFIRGRHPDLHRAARIADPSGCG